MRIFKSTVMAPCDVACLKWSSIAFGMFAGAFLSGFIKRHAPLFLAATLLLAVRPVVTYFQEG